MCVSAVSVDLVGQGELSTAGEYVHGARQGLRKDGFRLKISTTLLYLECLQAMLPSYKTV